AEDVLGREAGRDEVARHRVPARLGSQGQVISLPLDRARRRWPTEVAGASSGRGLPVRTWPAVTVEAPRPPPWRSSMSQPTPVPVNDEYSIGVVPAQMADGGWAVVASVKHLSPTGENITDLPIHDARYPTQAAAEQAGVDQARDWIDRNVPHAA